MSKPRALTVSPPIATSPKLTEENPSTAGLSASAGTASSETSSSKGDPTTASQFHP